MHGCPVGVEEGYLNEGNLSVDFDTLVTGKLGLELLAPETRLPSKTRCSLTAIAGKLL